LRSQLTSADCLLLFAAVCCCLLLFAAVHRALPGLMVLLAEVRLTRGRAAAAAAILALG
jgi:hypothetical protein